MFRIRVKLSRLTSPDEGWGGRLHVLAERPSAPESRYTATLGLAVRRPDAAPARTRPADENTPGPQLGDDHDNYRFRTPRDLARTPTPLRRVLVIGSCLTKPLPLHVRAANPTCPCDFILFNNQAELPESPPQPVADYDFQFVQPPLRTVLPDWLYFRAPYADTAAWEGIFAQACVHLDQLLDAALRWNTEHGLLTFVSNFMVPQQNALGRLLPRYDLRNPVHMVERLNQALDEAVRRRPNAYVLDLDQIAAGFGRKFVLDDSLLPTNHNAAMTDHDALFDQARIAPVPPASAHYTLRTADFAHAVWAELIAGYRTVRQIDTVKLVIVDLDDTLWRGVVAEDEEIAPETVEGWPLGLIETLGFLKRRGILLAIVSKNDEARVVGFWDRIMQGRLSLDDFAIRRINWDPKADNVAAVIETVNVLPGSVVFIDDNPVERAAVQAALPDIRVLGADQYYLRRILLWAAETQVPMVTDESARRTEMVRAGALRETTRQRMPRGEFLASLGLNVRMIEIADSGHKSFPRAFELINKTNQFNTTGRRWTQEAMRAALAGGTVLYAFEVEDRFSKYGLVGVVVADGSRIVQMVMSCRVVGLDVELAAMAEVLRRMRARGAKTVTAQLIETEANLLCRTLFDRCGFRAEPPGASGNTSWVSAPEGAPAAPAHVALA
jgi:FkbH-like protein